MTDHVIDSVARYAARTICTSWLRRPATASARKPATAPSQPTEAMTCAVSANLRRLDGIVTPNPVDHGRGRPRNTLRGEFLRPLCVEAHHPAGGGRPSR